VASPTMQTALNNDFSDTHRLFSFHPDQQPKTTPPDPTWYSHHAFHAPNGSPHAEDLTNGQGSWRARFSLWASYTAAPDAKPSEARPHPRSDEGGQGDTQSATVQEAGPVLALRQPHTAPRLTMQILGEWEGCVEEIGKDFFCAQLIQIGRTTPKTDEHVEFAKAELSEFDLQLLKIGAIFRWVIGYSRLPRGSKRRDSSIVFRRLPAWRTSEIEKARADADRLLGGLTVE
jgi:hypothetical protein